MKALFDTDNYKTFLGILAYSPDTKRGYQAQMAKSMGCQAAYLTRVIKDKAHITEDNALRLARFLGLSESATAYFLVLVRLGRASSPELRRYLESERKRLHQEHDRVLNRTRAAEAKFSEEALYKYFSSWVPSTVHMATSSENFQTVEAIADRLRLPAEKVESTLNFLLENGLVKKQNGKHIFSSAPMHFPRESPMNVAHQTIRRNQALRALDEGDPQNVHFSTVFTISPETLKELREHLLHTIEKSHKMIQASGTDEIYSICLDMFKVI